MFLFLFVSRYFLISSSISSVIHWLFRIEPTCGSYKLLNNEIQTYYFNVLTKKHCTAYVLTIVFENNWFALKFCGALFSALKTSNIKTFWEEIHRLPWNIGKGRSTMEFKNLALASGQGHIQVRSSGSWSYLDNRAGVLTQISLQASSHRGASSF